MTVNHLQAVRILLVEDNLQDIEITRRAFAKGRVRNDLMVVRDGEEALEYLYRRGKFEDPATSPRPGMILLDLNLPKVGGLEVLQQIKQDDHLKTIPVIVLTGIGDLESVQEILQAGTVELVTKPFEANQMLSTIKRLLEIAANAAEG